MHLAAYNWSTGKFQKNLFLFLISTELNTTFTASHSVRQLKQKVQTIQPPIEFIFIFPLFNLFLSILLEFKYRCVLGFYYSQL